MRRAEIRRAQPAPLHALMRGLDRLAVAVAVRAAVSAAERAVHRRARTASRERAERLRTDAE